MQRYLVLATVAATLAATGLAGPAQAVTPAANGQSADQQQALIQHSAQALQGVEQNHRFDALKRQAKGVFIVPSYKQGALIVGASGGDGVLLLREHGTWSDPAFYSIGSISVGAQAGGQVGSVVMLLMTNKAVHDFQNANNLSLNGKAGLTVANYSTAAEVRSKADVVIWSRARGAEAGISVSGSDITADTQANRQYYGQNVDTAQILHGRTNKLSADKLRSALNG